MVVTGDAIIVCCNSAIMRSRALWTTRFSAGLVLLFTRADGFSTPRSTKHSRSCCAAMSTEQDLPKPTLTFVTGNQKKLEEVQKILSTSKDFPFILTSTNLDLPELQGSKVTILSRLLNKSAASLPKKYRALVLQKILPSVLMP